MTNTHTYRDTVLSIASWSFSYYSLLQLRRTFLTKRFLEKVFSILDPLWLWDNEEVGRGCKWKGYWVCTPEVSGKMCGMLTVWDEVVIMTVWSLVWFDSIYLLCCSNWKSKHCVWGLNLLVYSWTRLKADTKWSM